MSKIINNILILVAICSGGSLVAQSGTYHLLTPSRDGAKQNIVTIVNNKNTKLFTMKSCDNCMPAVYTYNSEVSSILGEDVYGMSGIYIIPFDDNSYVQVAPKSPLVALGKGVWKTFLYSNFFSRDINKVKSMNTIKVEQWAVNLSKKIMSQGISKTTNRDKNIYYPAIEKSFRGGKKHSKVHITYDKKKLTISSINKEINEVYEYKPEFSKVLNIPVYGDNKNVREYMFIESPKSIISAKYNSGNDLSRSEWGKYESYNYFHNEEQKIRQLLISKAQQKNIDAKLEGWSLKAKNYKEQTYAKQEALEIKNRRLPKKGLRNNRLEAEALLASKNWAKQNGWNETVVKTYFTGVHWNLYRHTVTGTLLGRKISGIMVLKRTDGKCSFHYSTFTQEYNGSGYQHVFVEGITPGQYIMECKNIY